MSAIASSAMVTMPPPQTVGAREFPRRVPVTVSPKFQVVIPKEIRRELGVKPGDQLYAFEMNGQVTFERIPSLSEIQNHFKAVEDTARKGSLDSDLRIMRHCDHLLELYKEYHIYGIAPEIPELDKVDTDEILDRLEEAVPNGRSWYQKMIEGDDNDCS